MKSFSNHAAATDQGAAIGPTMMKAFVAAPGAAGSAFLEILKTKSPAFPAGTGIAGQRAGAVFQSFRKAQKAGRLPDKTKRIRPVMYRADAVEVENLRSGAERGPLILASLNRRERRFNSAHMVRVTTFRKSLTHGCSLSPRERPPHVPPPMLPPLHSLLPSRSTCLTKEVGCRSY